MIPEPRKGKPIVHPFKRGIMNSTLKKLLLLIAMFNVTIPAAALDSATAYETFSQSINRAFYKYFTLEAIFLLIAIILLLIAIAMLYNTRRANKIKQELLTLAMAKFDIMAEELNLRESSIVILKEIVQKTGLQDPASILKFSHVFEDSIEKYYESEVIESIPTEMFMQISALRKALGFSPLSKGIPLTSTRQLCGGEKCVIQIPDNEPSVNSETCQVSGSTEQYWYMACPEGITVQTGTWVHVSLVRPGDAEYTFRTQVLRDSTKELVLRHTSQLNRAQQRNWLRIDVDIPVKITILEDADAGETISGRIVDISGGGLGMALSTGDLGITLPTKLVNDSRLLLNFELPEHGWITNLPAKVIRVAGPFGGNHSEIVHSVAFTEGTNSINEKIIKFVFEKQRQNLWSR